MSAQMRPAFTAHVWCERTRYLKTKGCHLLGQGHSLLLKLGQWDVACPPESGGCAPGQGTAAMSLNWIPAASRSPKGPNERAACVRTLRTGHAHTSLLSKK